MSYVILFEHVPEYDLLSFEKGNKQKTSPGSTAIGSCE